MTALRNAKDLKNIVQHARMSNFTIDPIDEKIKEEVKTPKHTTSNTTTRDLSMPNENEEKERAKSDNGL